MFRLSPCHRAVATLGALVILCAVAHAGYYEVTYTYGAP
jgi:hypothetical protein